MTDRVTGRNADRTTDTADLDNDPKGAARVERTEYVDSVQQPPRTDFAAADPDRTVDGTTEFDRTEYDRDGTVNDPDAVDRDAVDRTDEAQQEEVTQEEVTQRQPSPAAEEASTRIFSEQDAERFRGQWRELQAAFVDEPRTAVQQADSLVTQMMDTLTAQLTEQKRALNGEWDRDGEVDTEALRIAMRRYRAVLDQMLSV